MLRWAESLVPMRYGGRGLNCTIDMIYETKIMKLKGSFNCHPEVMLFYVASLCFRGSIQMKSFQESPLNVKGTKVVV